MSFPRSCCSGRFSSAGGVQTGMSPGCSPLPLPPLVYVGKVSSERELPSSPRIGWVFEAAEPGAYAGHSLNAGDALVCTAMAPAEWMALAGPADWSQFVTFSDLATHFKAGLMSPADKAKLDGVEAGANRYVLPKATATLLGGVYVDVVLDASSDNPVENRAISVEMDAKADAADFLTISNREIFDIVTGG